MKRTTLIILPFLLLTIACKPAKPVWTDELKAMFMENCKKPLAAQPAEQALAYCECTLNKIMASYPDPNMVKTMEEDTLNALAADCVSLIMLKDSSNVQADSLSTSDTWNEATKVAFLDACKGELAGQTGINAEKYCNCTLEKVIKLYPKPSESANMTEKEVTLLAQDCLK